MLAVFLAESPKEFSQRETYRAQRVETEIQSRESVEAGERIDPESAYVVPAEVQHLKLGQTGQVYSFYFLRKETKKRESFVHTFVAAGEAI